MHRSTATASTSSRLGPKPNASGQPWRLPRLHFRENWHSRARPTGAAPRRVLTAAFIRHADNLDRRNTQPHPTPLQDGNKPSPVCTYPISSCRQEQAVVWRQSHFYPIRTFGKTWHADLSAALYSYLARLPAPRRFAVEKRVSAGTDHL
jgi:hypothetical protein